MSKNSHRKLSEDVRDEIASHEPTRFQVPHVNTTIQGWPVTLHKNKGHTMLIFASPATEASEAKFMAAYGSQNPDFVFGLIRQLANVSPQTRRLSIHRYEGEPPDVKSLKFATAALEGMSPRDPLDAMICTQLVAFQSLSMMSAGEMADASGYPDREREEQSLNGFSRIYCSLSEARERCRNSDFERRI